MVFFPLFLQRAGVMSQWFLQQLSQWTRPRRSLHKYMLVICQEPGRSLSKEPELRQRQWFAQGHPCQEEIPDDLLSPLMEHDPHIACVRPFLTPQPHPFSHNLGNTKQNGCSSE